jgi:condensin complex subunit 2
MSLLKEGDGVNFQKASCTLDGCVKIYTSRVDSVATDTGKLLSGLAENAGKKRRGEAQDGDAVDDDDADGEESEDAHKKRRRRAARAAEATLATDFAQLQNKKMELEFSVDPLFKKASADFDEGGAKGLLLNHLAIDDKGRIVFDSSDDANDASAANARATPAPDAAGNPLREETPCDESTDGMEVDVSGLAAKYFPDLSRLDEQDVCPSMKTFDLGDANGSMDLPFLKAPEDWRNDDKKADEEDAGTQSGVFLDDDNPMGFNDDDDIDMGGFDLPPETGFGEGGEVWAQEAIRDPQARLHVANMEEGEDEDGASLTNATAAQGPQYGLSMTHGRVQEQENILSYFDQALRKNWAGPEHWRIRRARDVGKAAPAAKRKAKELFEINFATPMSQAAADLLYTSATSNSTISLPKAQWKSRTRNLLPDDKHFNSKQLLRLFLKPKARLGSPRETRKAHSQVNTGLTHGEVDEAYWANIDSQNAPAGEAGAVQGNYDADFFQDDGLPLPGGPIDEDDDFADARDHFSPAPHAGPEFMLPLDSMLPSSQADAFGAQLVTQSRRFRPEYVQYARVAKKVDVKRLKDELWKGIGFEQVSHRSPCETVFDRLLTTHRSKHFLLQRLQIALRPRL